VQVFLTTELRKGSAMKKTMIVILTVLLVMALVVTAVLSINVELNLRIRRWAQELPMMGGYETYEMTPGSELCRLEDTQRLFKLMT